MIITKVDIVEVAGITKALFIHDINNTFTVFIDEYNNIRTDVTEFIFTSETPIIKIEL